MSDISSMSQFVNTASRNDQFSNKIQKKLKEAKLEEIPRAFAEKKVQVAADALVMKSQMDLQKKQLDLLG